MPTVGGEAVFDEAYADNCLWSTRCASGFFRARASHGRRRAAPDSSSCSTARRPAATASAARRCSRRQELGEDDPDKRPSVQVGDPFTGKKLIEASVELVERGLVESLQDCGAAGLASALAEMASDGAGIDVHLDRVPQREDGMEAWEIMISESQERMVAAVRPQMLDAVREVCARWELPCTVIGEVTDDGVLHAFHDGETVGEIPARFLTDECPRYEVERRPREVRSGARGPRATFESKRWIYEQYDHLVGSRTVRRPGLDAAVLRLRAVDARARGVASGR